MIPSNGEWPRAPLQTAWFIWALMMGVPDSDAASIYRCGNTYSTSPLCAGGDAVEIHTQASSTARTFQKTYPALNDWKEAELLEKKRLAAELQAAKQTSRRFIMPSPNSNLQETGGPSHLETNTPTNKRYPQSPYFTAKDPNASEKKKGNAHALPSEKNN